MQKKLLVTLDNSRIKHKNDVFVVDTIMKCQDV